jgi:hypothetical protein
MFSKAGEATSMHSKGVWVLVRSQEEMGVHSQKAAEKGQAWRASSRREAA